MERGEPRQAAGGNPSGSRNGWLVVALAIFGSLLFLQMSGRLSWPLSSPSMAPRAITARGNLAEDEKSQIELFQQASPSVVHVTSASMVRTGFRRNLAEIPQGSGSGFVWDSDGHIVTNYHVVKGASVVRVILVDNSSWDARPVGSAPDNDLAVLRIDAPANRIVAIPVGTSSDLQVGQHVFAIGNPFSLDQTLTTGVISGLGREIKSVTQRTIRDVIQTDAAINPGNSGGPLLDSAGRLIGINTAIFSPSGAYAGIGFAVPVDTINRIVPQLISRGKVDRPGLGIQVGPDSIVEQLRSRGLVKEAGVLVVDVIAGGAAEEAGIQPTYARRDGRLVLGDLIVALDGKPVENTLALFKFLDGRRVGETVAVTVVRGEERSDVELTLRPLPTSSP